MLQTKCRHTNTLPLETCCFCNLTAPAKLLDMCFNFINKHIDCICESSGYSGYLKLRDGISLPVEICDKLLNIRSSSLSTVDSNFINIFKDTKNTHLKRARLRKSDIYDHDIAVLLSHPLVELDLAECDNLTDNCLKYITESGSSLQSLCISDCNYVFNAQTFGDAHKVFHELNCLFLAPKLRKLTLRGCTNLSHYFYTTLLKSMPQLSHLDLSNCSDISNFEYAAHLSQLRSLILHNVDDLQLMLPTICKLTTLQHLDVSQSREDHKKFDKPTKMLTSLVESLPKLSSLDISGTNLAGTGVAESDSVCGTDISGLISRVNNPFQFLGLYETTHDACLRHDIPAKLVAGNANEEQILVASLAYLDRPDMLQKVLNELFHLFRFETSQYIGQALNVVLESMNRHLYKRHIQISGSATLFYIVKCTGKEVHESVNVKRRIISTLLDAMTIHKNDDTMMRNGCLTLCQFKIPLDVLFDYERLVSILLHSIEVPTESFVQRIGIYLLNSLACQVDGQQKVRLGQLGATDKMLWLISERLERGVCDDVLEVAWSTMWNVTDETPSNCRQFLENNGMEYFLACLKTFPDKEELLRNMMGLLGNVAEVRQLRHYLVTPEYLSVFSNLLDSRSDGIEVSYNAAGVLSHIASDGPEVWTVQEPTRREVLDKMVAAIDRWNLESQRNINYRSFEPILYLVKVYHTPECQRWAVWALANLTKVYPEKYCSLIELEGGVQLLRELLGNPETPSEVKTLATMVIENCRKFKEHDWQQELDG